MITSSNVTPKTEDEQNALAAEKQDWYDLLKNVCTDEQFNAFYDFCRLAVSKKRKNED